MDYVVPNVGPVVVVVCNRDVVWRWWWWWPPRVMSPGDPPTSWAWRTDPAVRRVRLRWLPEAEEDRDPGPRSEQGKGLMFPLTSCHSQRTPQLHRAPALFWTRCSVFVTSWWFTLNWFELYRNCHSKKVGSYIGFPHRAMMVCVWLCREASLPWLASAETVVGFCVCAQGLRNDLKAAMDKIDAQYLNEIVGLQEPGEVDTQHDLKVHEENTTIEELEVRTHTNTRAHTHTHTHTQMSIYTHTHTHTRTHVIELYGAFTPI